MKIITGLLVALALSLGIATTASAGSAALPEGVATGIALAYQNCMVAGGFDKSPAPSSRVALSGRTVIDYDNVVQHKIDSIDKCTQPFYGVLKATCKCDSFDAEIKLYADERARLVAWLAVGVVNVQIGGSGFETVFVGSARFKLLTGE